MCSFVLLRKADAQATVQTGKSYVNITKGLNGGTIEPGDTLEIRATIAVSGGQISLAHYVDSIPANTTYIPNSLKLLTNEGLVFKSYTDAPGDDPAYYDPAGYLRINMGSTNAAPVNLGGACSSTAPWSLPDGGIIRSNGRPSFYGSTCIMSASFRIVVNTALSYGSLVNMYGGAFYFQNNGTNTVNGCNAYEVILKENLGLCPNSIGANAIIENGGTFGSGNTQNRSTSAIVPGYTFKNVDGGNPNDGSYAIVNNMSPTGDTDPYLPKPDNAGRRVFNVWDIMGDHTGASNPTAGNLPVAPGNSGGYFVAINASYANSNAIQQTVGGLCPNTYYEFSAWFKNICEYCACDSAAVTPYSSGAPNPSFSGPDSSGVNPNLTFTVDGIDYYTTGTLKYTGQWVKKGFVYRTGPAQTSFTITIRNNAAGGGGNDWGIDDVTLATCTPNLTMNPSPSFDVCYGQSVDMSALIRCYFPNYIYWQWEKSVDNGVNWSLTSISGTGTPVLNGGEYEYVAGYPTFLADSVVNNAQYRLRIASMPSNLTDAACSYAATTTVHLTSTSCNILASDIKSFTGNLFNELASLQWIVVNEMPGTTYTIESSEDKSHFEKIGTLTSNASGTVTYHFTDPRPLSSNRYYRIRLSNGISYKYSRVVVVGKEAQEFALQSVINPFYDKISIELITPSNIPLQVSLLDAYGRVIRRTTMAVNKGLNTLSITKLEGLLPGACVVQIRQNDKILTTKLIKPAK